MCGIAGIFGAGNTGDVAARMGEALAHRGRDDSGMLGLTRAAQRCGTFVHRRLSVLDLSPAGHQPMASADGRWVITFNGEIYNFRKLRSELAAAGARFQSESDTEVLLAGVARDGPQFFRRLRGMFAFAIWDQQAGCGYLVRDAFGIKPLFVHESARGLAFASEVRALLEAGLAAPAIDVVALRGYLASGAIPEPRTAIQGVRALPAGHYVEIRFADSRVTTSVPQRFAAELERAEVATSDAREGAARVRAALVDSVQHHLVSDVPVALFLSGGVDSSALVALAATSTGRRLDTFTVVFEEAAYSEAAHARAVAERFETRHHEVLLRDSDLLAALPNALRAMDQPSMDGLNTYVVSQAVHDAGIKVVLSGLGGDEMFAGYPSFVRAARLAPYWPVVRRAGAALHRFVPTTDVRSEKLGLLLSERTAAAGAYEASRALFGRSAIASLAGGRPEIDVELAPQGLTPLQHVSWLELRGYMRNVLLRDSDVFSMAHHLELRVPFVDSRVAAASMAVADRLKVRDGQKKAVLIDAVRDLLPVQVWERPKQGFTLPFDAWMRGPLAPLVRDALVDRARVERVGLRPDAVRAVWDAYARRAGVSWSRPWALFTLISWAEKLGASVVGEMPQMAPVAVAAS